MSKRASALLFAVLAAAGLAGCSDAELCEECENSEDCADDLECVQFEDASWRCVESVWTTCNTKAHVTAP